jgi:hypothetical protein
MALSNSYNFKGELRKFGLNSMASKCQTNSGGHKSLQKTKKKTKKKEP